jgi:hypothetical protein
MYFETSFQQKMDSMDYEKEEKLVKMAENAGCLVGFNTLLNEIR